MTNMISFDRAADIYDQTRGFPPGVGEQVAAALVAFAGLKAADPLLEIGVGTGRIARPLAAALGPSHHLFGIDISRRMMGRLRDNFGSETRLPRLVESDAQHLPFPDRHFRALLTVHVLHLMREWQAVIGEMSRVRAPDGVFIGGWNDHPAESSGERINLKFRELAAAHGVPAERQGLSEYPDLVRYLPPAVRVSEIVAAEWTIARAPRLALQAVAERHFSSSWMVPDEVYPALYAEIESWAKKEWPDRDRAIPEKRWFKWMRLEFEGPSLPVGEGDTG
jgi:SAM-dependent methyltransferase